MQHRNAFLTTPVVMFNIYRKIFYKTICTKSDDEYIDDDTVDKVVERLLEELEEKEYTEPDKKEIRHAMVFLGWLVKEVKKDLESHRDKERKIHDNEIVYDMIRILKDKEEEQCLEIKTPHGSSVK